MIHLAASASQQPILLNAPFVSPELSVNTELKTMDRVVSDSLEQRRFSMLLLALFAAVALLAAAAPARRATQVDPLAALRDE